MGGDHGPGVTVPGALAALEACGIDSARRAETLSVAEFTSVARLLSAK